MVIAAAGAGAAVILAPPDDRPITAAVVAGVAAAVQAATAVIIVWLTGRLVSAARQAQEASTSALGIASDQAAAARDSIAVARDQLEIAERTDLHARRDRQLLAVPLVSAEYMTHSDFEAESDLQVTVRNEGDSPALAVRLTVGGRRDVRDAPDGYEARSIRGETLQPGEEKTIHVAMTAFRNPAAQIESHDQPKGLWTYPFFSITVSYRAMLGQSVRLEYGWFAGAPTGWPDNLWVARRLHIDLDVEGAQPVDLEF
jgi:hypothetical protein